LLEHGIGRFDAPLLVRAMRCWAEADSVAIARLNADFLASRESAELRAESVQMGFSLNRLLADLRNPALNDLRAVLAQMREISFPIAWSGIAAAWGIAPEPATAAYLWSWAENQVMAALKSVPVGQAGGQRLLAEL
jgi:urease accessory protein